MATVRDGFKTPKECANAFVEEFLKGKEEPLVFQDRMMSACKKCKDFETCFPPFEKWDDSMKNFAKNMYHALTDEGE